MAEEQRRNVVSTRLTDTQLAELDQIIADEGITDRAAILYKITFDFLKEKRLKKAGRVIEAIHTPKPPFQT